jgi:ATP-dependent Clp protease ATP-binding subunit ClpA
MRAFHRLDASTERVLEAALNAAIQQGEHAIATQHLLLALATADPVTGQLLADAGADETRLRSALFGPSRTRFGRQDHESLLATLGIDLAEVRRRAESTFGHDRVAHAAARVRPAPARRRWWSWISCSMPARGWLSGSPLGGGEPVPIPRVTRLLERARRAAHPRRISPADVLLALVTGQEPAGEVLELLGVDLDALASAIRRVINQPAGVT